MAKEYTNPTPIERLAAGTVDDAYERNKKHWFDRHKIQYRLYESVRNFNKKRKLSAAKTTSYNRKGFALPTTTGRSNIQIGTMWMLHNIANSIVCQSLIEADDLMELESRRKAKKIFLAKEMGDFVENLFTDDIPNIKESARKAIWDLLATGATVLCPSWRTIYKRILERVEDENGEEQRVDSEVELGGYPMFDHYSPWDTFPTAGATDPKNLHEIIFRSKMTIAELRDWEKQGLIKNVDAVISNLKHDGKLGLGSKTASKRSSPKDNNEDDGYQIEILISYCLFPLYKHDEYIDNEGKDRSKDEVECIIIKAANADPILMIDRNPFACQEKAFILAGWYFIPGEFYPISVFEIAEKLIQHYEDIFNLIQDGANQDIYPTELIPKEGVDEAELAGGGPGRRIRVPNDQIKDGVVPKYMERPNTILPQMYNQRDFVGEFLQQLTTIVNLVRAVSEPGESKTATEIDELAMRADMLFKQAAIRIEASLMKPIWEWIMVMLSEFSDDEEMAVEFNSIDKLTKLPLNPFKQFQPVMPNPDYRIKLTGALRANESQANQMKLTNLIAIAKDLPPMPDENGQMVAINTILMYLDLAKMSKLPDVDRYKLILNQTPLTEGETNVPSSVGMELSQETT